jgi:tRNA threonylcarbamoyladenosine biosynthesis protein TsaE
MMVMKATEKITFYRNCRIENINQVAKTLIEDTAPVRIFAIKGEMGAGKTTLVKAMCRAIGVGESVTSPTFALVNEYRTEEGAPVYHFDFYRINSETEALDIGIETYLYSGEFCFIEWPERIPNLIPSEAATITLEGEGAERDITLSL